MTYLIKQRTKSSLFYFIKNNQKNSQKFAKNKGIEYNKTDIYN